MRVNVDDEVAACLARDLGLLGRRQVGGLRLADLEELHAGDLVGRQHGRREPRRGADEVPPRQAAAGGTGVDAFTDPLSHVAGQEEPRALLLRRHGALGGSLVSLEVLEDVELHGVPPEASAAPTARSPRH